MLFQGYCLVESENDRLPGKSLHKERKGMKPPQTEEQVIKLAAFLRIRNVPLVPRGKATSG